MRRALCLSAAVSACLLVSAQAAAASPQLYVGSNPDYTVVFSVDSGSVSVLGLDSPFYCGETEPSHHFGPGTMSLFGVPTPMREGASGLEAPLGDGGGPSSKIEAEFDGTKLTGTFAFDFSEESFHCQTAAPYPARPEVAFEAVRYEPVEGGATLPASKGEVPIYYGSEGGTETLLEPGSKSVVFRGAAPSNCPVAGGKPALGMAPLFGDVIDTNRKADGFSRTIHRSGKVGVKLWNESRSVTGTVTEEAISGSYVRTTTTRRSRGAARRCKTGPLDFRAVRYLPAASPPPT